MTATHTPGPWQVIEYAGGVTSIEHHEPTGYGYRQSDIARIQPLSEQKEANARLIASAPDMLAALESVYAYVTDIFDESEFSPDIVEEIRAAIAKAEGG